MLFLEDTQSQINSARNILKKKIVKDYISANAGITHKDIKNDNILSDLLDVKVENILSKLLTITRDYQDKSIPNNPAINQAHLPFLANFYNEGINLDLIKFYYDKFLNTPSVHRNKEMFKDFHSFETTVDANQKIDSKIKDVNIEDSPIYEDENIKVFLGNSLDKCIKYGQGEKYGLCISRTNKSNNLYHYYRKEKELTTYFVYFKDLEREIPFMIVDATNDPEVFSYNTIESNNDYFISKNDLISKFPFLEKAINRNIFKSIPIEGKEKEFYDKFYNKSITSLDSVEDQLTFLSFHMEVDNDDWQILMDNLQKNEMEILIKTAIENDYSFLPNILWENFPKLKERYLVKVRRRADLLEKEIREKVVDGIYEGNIDITRMEILPNLSDITVNGSFNCYYSNLVNLEGAPKSVLVDFYCAFNNLTSLEGAPESVDGDFNCYNNELVNLKGAPKSVGRGFYCYNNKLVSLEGAPKSVGEDFNCYDNQLVNLKGSPESVGGGFYCYSNQLVSLKGAPKIVGRSFDCEYNQLVSLEGAPKSVGRSFDCQYNQLVSLEGAPESVGGNFYCHNNPVKFTDEDIENAMKERAMSEKLKSESFKYFFFNK